MHSFNKNNDKKYIIKYLIHMYVCEYVNNWYVFNKDKHTLTIIY